MSAVHQGGVGAPNELATFRVHDAVVDFVNEVCGKHEVAPRLIQDLLENFSGRCWPRSPREIVFFRNSGKFQKIILPHWVHRRPFRQSLAGIFRDFELLAFHCHRSWGSGDAVYRTWNSAPCYIIRHMCLHLVVMDRVDQPMSQSLLDVVQ